MAKDYKALASSILKATGGVDNISVVSHCYTRLRLTINSTAKAPESAIKAIPGVLGLVVHGKEYQIVLGTEVADIYQTFLMLGEFKTGGEVSDPKSAEEDSKINKKSKVLSSLFDFIAGTFSPCIPVLIAGGLTGAVLTILTNFFGVSPKSGTYTVFSAINQAAFYFLPIFIGFSGARKLNINSWLGAFLGAVLLFSTINGAKGLSFIGIPITTVAYNSTVFPILLGVGFMAIIYKFFNRILPKEIKTIFLPLITMLITVPVTLIVLGPIGGIMGNWLSIGVGSLYKVAGPLAVMIIGAATPFLVFFGMNNALYPLVFALFAEMKCDPLILAGMLSANVAVGAACLAVGIKAKNSEIKGVGISAGVTGLLGITEPGVYGILFPLKRPLIGAVVGGGIGGLLCGLFKVAGYAVASPSFATLVTFIPSKGSMWNFYGAVIVAVVSVIVSFAVTWFVGFKEPNSEAK